MNHLQFSRLKSDESQGALAGKLGIHPTLLSRLERGWFTRPPAGLEDRLKEAFGAEWTFSRLMEPVPDLHPKRQKRASLTANGGRHEKPTRNLSHNP